MLYGDGIHDDTSAIQELLDKRGNVSIDFASNFISSGINQVQDNVTVDVDVEISAMVPFYKINSNIHSSVIVTQMVIIGDVPQTYLNIGENTNDR